MHPGTSAYWFVRQKEFEKPIVALFAVRIVTGQRAVEFEILAVFSGKTVD
jgi:hypothetical protein